jgi:sporulation protein YtfJ
MAEHPLQNLMKTAMENIKGMVDVNTIVGDPVETNDGSVIIPISRVSFGFAAGGSEFESVVDEQKSGTNGNLPFGGGSGGGVTVSPVACLVVSSNGQVRMLPVDHHAMLDRLIDLAPQLVSQLQSWTGNNKQPVQRNYQI